MLRRDVLAAAALTPVAAAAMSPSPALPEPAPLDDVLAPVLARERLPALAAAVVVRGEVVAAGAVGVRRVGTQRPVKLGDRWHIGSDQKAMTALLAATFVDAGALRWESTVAESFPELVAGMDPGVRTVQLRQLLSHSSGIPSDTPPQNVLLGQVYTASDGNLDEMRYWIVERLVKQPLQSPPGARFAYSNFGYVLAGAMLERASGRTFEELLAERVFDALGLATAGFGPQSSVGRVDAPLGHVPLPDGSLKPMLAGPNGDNPAVLGPAGTSHMSVLDFATWAGWNAGGGARGPRLVTPETLRLLHTPQVDLPARPDAAVGTPREAGGYGFGWGTYTPDFSGRPVMGHNGSNGLNVAQILMVPARDYASVAVTNAGGERAEAALKDVTKTLYGRFLPATE